VRRLFEFSRLVQHGRQRKPGTEFFLGQGQECSGYARRSRPPRGRHTRCRCGTSPVLGPSIQKSQHSAVSRHLSRKTPLISRGRRPMIASELRFGLPDAGGQAADLTAWRPIRSRNQSPADGASRARRLAG